MKNKIKVPSLVTISVLTLITIIFWVGFEVYRVLTTKPTPDVPAEILRPLNLNIDTEALNKLQDRIYLTESEIDRAGPQPLPIPTPQPASEEPSETPAPEEQ